MFISMLITLALSLVSLICIIDCKSQIKSVTVFGGTGGVGQLICKSLIRDNFEVNVVTRDITKATSYPYLNACKIYEGDALIPETIVKPLKDARNVIISVGTTAFPSKKWENGNNPRNACVLTVQNILSTISKFAPKLETIILISSIGVERTNQFPFKLLNLYGVLDAKRESENLVSDFALNSNCCESFIVRPGRLVGEPFTNFDLAKLFGINQGNSKGIIVSDKDSLSGDVERADVAMAVTKLLQSKRRVRKSKTFSIINSLGSSPTEGEWMRLLQLPV